jgi:hypothetical protein
MTEVPKPTARHLMRGAGRLTVTLGMIATSVVLAACGSGARQDAHEPRAKFPVSITVAKFPAHQRLSEHTRLEIAVTNTGRHAIPNVAVTICNVTCAYPAPVGQGTSVDAFADYLNMAGVASHSRPVWIVDRPPGPCGYSCQNGGPGSYFTSDANTWAAGRLKPGATARFTWGVTAVASGTHTVAWAVAAGLYGKARAVLADGSLPHGAFKVTISRSPGQSFVNGSGQIVSH